MKNSFAIAVLTFGAIVLGTNTVQAQNHNATTTAKITLGDVISIDAGSTAIDGAIAFNYATAADYNTVQTVAQANALKVTSTKAFDVKVKAGGADFLNGTNKIPVNVLTIKAAAAPGSMGGTKSDVNLSTADQTLVADAPLGSALTLNLDYTIPAAKSSSADILGKPAGTYTQTVIYTATAK
ncbi:peptidoglycan-binding protein LysM [Marnyiella aurantia]|uniref:Peptidoglycan-binding protein LysM n=1 Tax=Marnyiella aurantia TaxID=2758037 RepID=A0A7D7LSV9_9FLAO|nr:peptidoglycan-binding protein LysM [Marnyiella aurantia]MBA5245592.1 peptidoglycan-binding protein LysM [Marnyiella aurantia]MBP0613690.1 peptidoglycan-binding protein LysM [Marnyiella aurantia]QMS98997.1 peptidoglycan-binding protein LysM [Marnyiella aurantia]